MSTLAVNAVTDANGGNTATINSMTPTADSLQGFRNRLINSDMRIDQRNAGASVNMSAVVLPVDRWKAFEDTDGDMTAEQVQDAPSGFTDSVKITTTTADGSLSASQYARFFQAIEGLNVADLGWGTSSAKTVTLSFWVKSSLTGTFGGALENSAFNRSYPYTYTISVADTWEYKTVTIPGDTSGTWLKDNGIGILVDFGLGVGSTFSGTAGSWAGAGYVSATGAVSVIGTLNATWYITGVQLEVGSVATPFERRPYGTELSLCERYCQTLDSAGGTDKAMFSGVAYLNNTIIASYTFAVMRVAPTITITNPTQMDVVTSAVTTANNTLSFAEITSKSCQPAVGNSGTPFTAGHGAVIRFDGASIVLSAEL
jgi:hypothetical protein